MKFNNFPEVGILELLVDLAFHKFSTLVGFDIPFPFLVNSTHYFFEGLFSEKAKGKVISIGQQFGNLFDLKLF